MEFSSQGGCQIEAEAVDMHLGDPVAQRIHNQLQRVWVAHIQGVTGAGVVHVVLAIAFDQAVVGLVVDASEADGWAHVVALGGVVVDHVEDDLNAGIVKCAHHALELADCSAWLLGSRVVLMWC